MGSESLKDARMANRCATLGLDIKDAELFFRTLTQKHAVESLEIDILVDLCTRLRGVAQSVDLCAVTYAQQVMQNDLQYLCEMQDKIVDFLAKFEVQDADPDSVYRV